jgi:hypothetical protein
MTQEDLFEWAKQMNKKYGFKEEQYVLPFIQEKKTEKSNETSK